MTVEFVGKINPKPIKNWEQELAEERAQFRADEERRKLKRLGLLNETKPKETRERLEDLLKIAPLRSREKSTNNKS